MKPNEFAQKLIELHGIDKALSIVETNLKVSLSTRHELFFNDEVNWHYNAKFNTLEFPRELDKNHKGLKQKRDTKTRNFYKATLIELNRKVI